MDIPCGRENGDAGLEDRGGKIDYYRIVNKRIIHRNKNFLQDVQDYQTKTEEARGENTLIKAGKSDCPVGP